MQAKNIDDVVNILDDLLASDFREEPLALFAALYRQVTVSVRQGIQANAFDDAARMDAFDTAFANRYFAALAAWRQASPVTKSWEVAFRAASPTLPRIHVQHLLLGMNAHINLDLGLAAAAVAPGSQIAGLEQDFERINTILGSLLDEAQAALNAHSPLFQLLDDVGGRVDEAVINFSLKNAREAAWDTALDVAPLQGRARARLIKRRDRFVSWLGHRILHPGPLLEAAVLLVGSQEARDYPAIVHDFLAITPRVPTRPGPST